jgi:hypothetical protein
MKASECGALQTLREFDCGSAALVCGRYVSAFDSFWLHPDASIDILVL